MIASYDNRSCGEIQHKLMNIQCEENLERLINTGRSYIGKSIIKFAEVAYGFPLEFLWLAIGFKCAVKI